MACSGPSLPHIPASLPLLPNGNRVVLVPLNCLWVYTWEKSRKKEGSISEWEGGREDHSLPRSRCLTSHCWKIHLYNLVGEKWKREKRMKGKRWVARRLSNYPFKPNLRCCLKLTYANGKAGWQLGLQWLRFHCSEISFHILSQYYQMQIFLRRKTLGAIFSRRRFLTACQGAMLSSFHV